MIVPTLTLRFADAPRPDGVWVAQERAQGRLVRYAVFQTGGKWRLSVIAEGDVKDRQTEFRTPRAAKAAAGRDFDRRQVLRVVK